jgi:hypothetical protein
LDEERERMWGNVVGIELKLRKMAEGGFGMARGLWGLGYDDERIS